MVPPKAPPRAAAPRGMVNGNPAAPIPGIGLSDVGARNLAKKTAMLRTVLLGVFLRKVPLCVISFSIDWCSRRPSFCFNLRKIGDRAVSPVFYYVAPFSIVHCARHLLRGRPRRLGAKSFGIRKSCKFLREGYVITPSFPFDFGAASHVTPFSLVIAPDTFGNQKSC